MKRNFLLWLILFLSSSALAEAPPHPLPWERVEEIYFTPSQVRMYGPDNVVYIQCQIPQPYGACRPNVWHRFDLKPLGVAPDAKFAFLSGMLIISHGYVFETSNLTVTFRRPGDNAASCAKYLGQAQATQNMSPPLLTQGGDPYIVPVDSARSNMATWVPVSNGEIDWCYAYSGAVGLYPHGGSAYAINLSVQAWAR